MSEYKELCERLRGCGCNPNMGPVCDKWSAVNAIERLERERDARRAKLSNIEAAAEDATEYVLAQINKDLRAEITRLTEANKARASWLDGKHKTAVDDYVDDAERTIDALRAQLAAAEQDAVGLAKAIERGGFCLAEMMQAYERRIRSDCKSPDELEKRPWECAEYIAASSYLRTMFPIRDAALAQASPDEQKGGGE